MRRVVGDGPQQQASLSESSSAGSSAGRVSHEVPTTPTFVSGALGNSLQIQRMGPNASEHSGSDVRKAKSFTTESLRSGICEWWVLRPPSLFSLVNSATDNDDAPVELAETWAGGTPTSKMEDGPCTPMYQRGMFSCLRQQAAGRRRRFNKHGFDLDLAYVTSRIIAMGFPGAGLQAAFRNPRAEVARFLNWSHKDHYRIYNLCVEESHCSNGFDERTVRYPCKDHCPPTLEMLLSFCKNAEAWLLADKSNVVIVHCKAGKGRSGSFICALLVYSRAVRSAYEALRWFEWARGGTRSGVTIPDQIRWVAMLERWVNKKEVGLSCHPFGSTPAHKLVGIRLGPLRSNLLRPVTESGISAESHDVSVRIGMVSRMDLEKGLVTHWYDPVLVQPDGENAVTVSVKDGGPCWEHADGLLVVQVVSTYPTCSRLPEKMKVNVWWHRAFLHATGPNMELAVSKAWVGGLQRDLNKHRKTPCNFHFFATFQDFKSPESMKRLDTIASVAHWSVSPTLSCDSKGCAGSFQATGNADATLDVAMEAPPKAVHVAKEVDVSLVLDDVCPDDHELAEFHDVDAPQEFPDYGRNTNGLCCTCVAGQTRSEGPSLWRCSL